MYTMATQSDGGSCWQGVKREEELKREGCARRSEGSRGYWVLDWAIPNFYHYGSTHVKTVELPVTTGDNLSFVTTCLVWLQNKTLGEAGQKSVKNLN
jgi:hypothetical protein